MKYKYYPIVVTLDRDEFEAYDNLSYEIAKCIIKGKNGKISTVYVSKLGSFEMRDMDYEELKKRLLTVKE